MGIIQFFEFFYSLAYFLCRGKNLKIAIFNIFNNLETGKKICLFQKIGTFFAGKNFKK